MRSAMATVRSSICPSPERCPGRSRSRPHERGTGGQGERQVDGGPGRLVGGGPGHQQRVADAGRLNTRLPSAGWVRHRANPASLKPAASSATGAAAAGSDRTTPSLTARTPDRQSGRKSTSSCRRRRRRHGGLAAAGSHQQAVPSTTKSHRFLRIIAMAHSCCSADPAPIPGNPHPTEEPEAPKRSDGSRLGRGSRGTLATLAAAHRLRLARHRPWQRLYLRPLPQGRDRCAPPCPWPWPAS